MRSPPYGCLPDCRPPRVPRPTCRRSARQSPLCGRCRAKPAHIGQSGPDSGPGFQVNVRRNRSRMFEIVLECSRRGPCGCRPGCRPPRVPRPMCRRSARQSPRASGHHRPARTPPPRPAASRLHFIRLYFLFFLRALLVYFCLF